MKAKCLEYKALNDRAGDKAVTVYYKSNILQKLYVLVKLFNRMISRAV